MHMQQALKALDDMAERRCVGRDSMCSCPSTIASCARMQLRAEWLFWLAEVRSPLPHAQGTLCSSVACQQCTCCQQH